MELDERTNFEGLEDCHWAGRFLLGEYMTSEPYFGDQVISEFTLLLLEDLGFYKTNKYTGGLMKFGKNQGCDFLYKDCFSDIYNTGMSLQASFCYEFCNSEYQITCSSGRQSRTYCSYYPDTDLPDKYTRTLFPFILAQGREDADYCFVSDIYYKGGAETDYQGNCKIGSKNYGNKLTYWGNEYINKLNVYSTFHESVGDIITDDSFCALSSLVHKDDKNASYSKYIRPTCYPMFCSETSLTIKIYKQYVVCPKYGGFVQITNYTGYLYCPQYDLICTGSTLCNNMFDCVNKNSTSKTIREIDETLPKQNRSSFIEGSRDNDVLKNLISIEIEYELSGENSKCPLNCSQCLENRRCFACNDKNAYKGKRENEDTDPIECLAERPKEYSDTIKFLYVYNTSYYINGTKKEVVFEFIEGCVVCEKAGVCSQCDSTFEFVDYKCRERIHGCKDYYTEGPSVDYNSVGNFNKTAYTECENCNNGAGYFCILLDNDMPDRKNCYPIKKEIDEERYIQKDDCYKKCSQIIEHCEKCNSTQCLECIDRYHLSNNNSMCKISRKKPLDNECILTIDYNTLKNKPLSDIKINELVDDYLINYPNYTQNVTHYVNIELNYTITLFISAICTKNLLKEEYFSINDTSISNRIMRTIDIFENFDENETVISVFIAYGDKNYYYTVFSLDSKETPLQSCVECTDLKIEIENSFAKIIRKKLGYIVLDLIKGEELDVFSEDKGALNEFCKNVTLLGIDIPLNKRKNYLYVHKFKNAYLCLAENCISTKIKLKDATSECVCNQTYQTNYNAQYEEFTFYNETNSNKRSKVKDAFEVFDCVEETFNYKHFISNFGFFISIICIILQLILFLIYIIIGKPINFSKNTSAPPKRVYLRVNAEWIKTQGANLVNNHDEEKDIQSKDEIDDEFVIEEFNYNIDKHESSSYSIDTDLAKKQDEANKVTEKDNLKEKPDGKKKILILLPDKKDEGSDEMENDLQPIEKEKRQEKKGFLTIYWIILSLKQHIINYFSCIKFLKITESFVPVYIMGIRSLLMIIFVFFVNAICLTQNYFDKKFEYFNKKYSMIPAMTPIKISTSEKLNYGFGHTILNSIIISAIYLAIQLILGLFVFSVRKEITELFTSKDVLKINSLAKTMKAKYIIFFVVNILFMIAFFMFLTNFNGVYVGSATDFGAGGFWSLLWLEIFPFIWSLILAIFRYFGISKQNKILYDISQFFMF